MDPCVRQRALKFLCARRPNSFLLCRDAEALCHSVSATPTEYNEHVRRSAHNLSHNPDIRQEVVVASDAEVSQGCLVGKIDAEREARMERFNQMLQEKYDALNDKTFEAIVRCRRCGDENVTWEEKQTRSADEGATLFCTCIACGNRWVLR